MKPGRLLAEGDVLVRCLTVIALVSLGLVSAVVPAAQPGSEAPAAFDIEAHRGGRALRPENTLQSFAHALSMGVDTLELDMGVTKDGVVVVSHERGLNPDLARAEDGRYVAAPGTPFVN
jgi:glycerophosphoryl diester phosphodiesterase